jgi:sulfoxide reductase catalytic subunit YedY
MHIRRRKGWEIAESEATPESLFLNRRSFVGGAAALTGSAAVAGSAWLGASAATIDTDPTASLYPARHNDAFTLDRPVTPETVNGTYNNFYEFSFAKNAYTMVGGLKTRPWSVKIDGLVDKPMELGIDDLIKAMALEERLYRHRCVEAWSMTIPWTGFPVRALIDLAKPTSAAKYIRFETFMDPKMAPQQRQALYPWPYVEALTMAEGASDLAFMVTGAYGKPLAKQHGAPLRLAVPWKYGFKSIKSIVRVSFTDKRPIGLWEALQPSEYGFWANVNPEVPHPRWSQATEDVLGQNERRPTLMFNGYGAEVADLYKNLKGENLYM